MDGTGRDLLMRILDAFVSKFAALNIQFPSCLRQYKKKKNNGSANMETDDPEDFDFDRARSIHTSTFVPDATHDGIKGSFALLD